MNELFGMTDPEDRLRAVGGKWAKHPCEKCADRTYTLPVSEYVIFCIGCLEDEDECSCDQDQDAG